MLTSHDRLAAALRRAPAKLPAAIALLVLSQAAFALDLPRYDYQGASGVCLPSTPAFEAAVRARPLGLANESAGTVFITCPFRGTDPTLQVGAYQVQVQVGNNDVVSKAITCTLVVTYRLPGQTVDRLAYVPRSVGLVPGGGNFITWGPTDFTGVPGAQRIPMSAVSCAMPALTTVHYTGNYYYQDVGT